MYSLYCLLIKVFVHRDLKEQIIYYICSGILWRGTGISRNKLFIIFAQECSGEVQGSQGTNCGAREGHTEVKILVIFNIFVILKNNCTISLNVSKLTHIGKLILLSLYISNYKKPFLSRTRKKNGFNINFNINF